MQLIFCLKRYILKEIAEIPFCNNVVSVKRHLSTSPGSICSRFFVNAVIFETVKGEVQYW